MPVSPALPLQDSTTYKDLQIGDLLAQITGEPSPTLPSSTAFAPKRKASGDLPKPAEKIQRTNSNTQPANSSHPIAQPARTSTVSSSMAKMNLARKPSIPSPTATFKNGQPTPPPTTDPAAPAKPPKKGSFAEIMARGKQAQASLGQVGKIQHKKIEKAPSKREREDMKNLKAQRIQKNLGPNGKFKSAVSSIPGRSGEREKTKTAPVQEKKPKKAAVATTGYTGTARPKPGSANSLSKPSASSSSRYERVPDRYRDDRRPSKRYDSEDEDELDYDSDASSDMEATGFEVDDEEERAARIARKEDAEALAEENRLKREKEEKKRRLAAMAKSRR